MSYRPEVEGKCVFSQDEQWAVWNRLPIADDRRSTILAMVLEAEAKQRAELEAKRASEFKACDQGEGKDTELLEPGPGLPELPDWVQDLKEDTQIPLTEEDFLDPPADHISLWTTCPLCKLQPPAEHICNSEYAGWSECVACKLLAPSKSAA